MHNITPLQVKYFTRKCSPTTNRRPEHENTAKGAVGRLTPVFGKPSFEISFGKDCELKFDEP